MTQEEKDLLLKDLCARLPYEAHVYIEFENGNILDDTVLNAQYIHDWMAVPSCQNMAIKPYLRPISTMTSNELDELIKRLNHTSAGRIINKENFQIMPVLNVVWFTNMKEYECVSTRMMSIVIDFLNEYHFDYNDLISMDMAIEAPKDMYKID
jgi:hypothetical protein